VERIVPAGILALEREIIGRYLGIRCSNLSAKTTRPFPVPWATGLPGTSVASAAARERRTRAVRGPPRPRRTPTFGPPLPVPGANHPPCLKPFLTGRRPCERLRRA